MSKVSGTASARLRTDYMRLKKDPVPYVSAEPLPSNILEWHYVVKGPEDSPYKHGFYHGKLVFSKEYPFRPPSIYMITPSGRFKTNQRLCLSISDFHPDTWNPAWSVSTILTGLLSFMLEKSPTFGSIETTDSVKRQYASQSLAFNTRNKTFCELFPEMEMTYLEAMKTKLDQSSATNVPSENGVLSGPGAKDASKSDDNQNFSANLSTAIITVSFVVFAYACKMVIQNIMEDSR